MHNFTSGKRYSHILKKSSWAYFSQWTLQLVLRIPLHALKSCFYALLSSQQSIQSPLCLVGISCTRKFLLKFPTLATPVSAHWLLCQWGHLGLPLNSSTALCKLLNRVRQHSVASCTSAAIWICGRSSKIDIV